MVKISGPNWQEPKSRATLDLTLCEAQGMICKELQRSISIWDALGVYADGYSSFDVNAVLFENSLATMHLAWDSKELKEKM